MRVTSSFEPGHAPRGECELGDQSNPSDPCVWSLASLPWLGFGTYANLSHEGREWERWRSCMRQVPGLREVVHAET